MINDFNGIIEQAGAVGPKTIAVAVAQDEDVLKAVSAAHDLGIASAVLVGDKPGIESISISSDLDIRRHEIINVRDKVEACRQAVHLVRQGRASILMKGFVDTGIILKAVLDKESRLMTGSLLSHVGVLAVEGFDRFFILSDAAMNIAPTLDEKAAIIRNAVKVAHALGNPYPKVAVLCAAEETNSPVAAALDAARLVSMNQRGEVDGCIIGGPFALDIAISAQAANHECISHPVAGCADILITPNLEAGNILNKSMEYFAGARKAGIIMGAGAPIILTSRASSHRAKLNSIALSVLVADIQ